MSQAVTAFSMTNMYPSFVRVQKTFFVLYLLSLITSISGMEIFSALLAAGTLVWVFVFQPKLREPIPFSRPIFAFAMVMAVGILLGGATIEDKIYDFGRMRFFALYFVLYLNLKYVVDDSPWLDVLAWGVLAVGIYGFVQHFIPLDLVRPEGKKVFLYAIQDEKIGPLVLGTFNHHLTFSNIFLIYASMFFALGFSGHRKRLFYGFLGGLLFLLCIWTQSRAAWMAVPVCLLLIASFRSRRWLLGGLALVVALGVGFYSLDAGFQQRFDRTLFKQDNQFNLGPRMRLWSIQWDLFKEHPLIGTGWNNNERVAKQYMDAKFPNAPIKFYGHAHSEILQVLATTGLLGLIAFIWIWFRILKLNVLRIKNQAVRDPSRWLYIGILAAWVGFHLQGLSQWNFGDAEVLHSVIFFWALIAAGSKVPGSLAAAPEHKLANS